MNLIQTQISSALPSAVFATRPHDRVSDRYSFIPTASVVEALQEDGWRVWRGTQKSVRDKSREGFQTHLLRFVRNDVQSVGDLKDQFSLLGRFSHDTSSSIQFMAGIIVFACANGVIVSEGEVSKVRFIHRHIDLNEVVRAARDMVSVIPKLQDRVNVWRNLHLSEPVRQEFANAAAIVRWGKTRLPGSDHPAAPVLLSARRFADNSDDLWNTFNRVQENLINGAQYFTRSRGRRWHTTSRVTRRVGGLDQNIGINQSLWELGRRVEQGLPLLQSTADGNLILAE